MPSLDRMILAVGVGQADKREVTAPPLTFEVEHLIPEVAD